MSTTASETTFTYRQREVVALLADGRTHKEIGAALGISERTAKAHCDRLRQKLGATYKRDIVPAFREWQRTYDGLEVL